MLLKSPRSVPGQPQLKSSGLVPSCMVSEVPLNPRCWSASCADCQSSEQPLPVCVPRT